MLLCFSLSVIQSAALPCTPVVASCHHARHVISPCRDASAQCCQCARPSLFTGLGALFCRESLCRLLLPRKHLVAVLQYLGTLQARGYSPAAATLAGRDLPHSLRLPDRPVVTCRTRPPAWPACCDLPHLLRLPDLPLVAFRTRSA